MKRYFLVVLKIEIEKKTWVQSFDLPCIATVRVDKYVVSVHLSFLIFKIWYPNVVPHNWQITETIRKRCYTIFILNRGNGVQEWLRDCYEANNNKTRKSIQVSWSIKISICYMHKSWQKKRWRGMLPFDPLKSLFFRMKSILCTRTKE